MAYQKKETLTNFLLQAQEYEANPFMQQIFLEALSSLNTSTESIFLAQAAQTEVDIKVTRK